MSILDSLLGKKIAIVGLGVNNQKLAEFLKARGFAFEVIDGWKNPDELIGKLDNFDLIFRTPGLPYLSLAVQQAKSNGVKISSQTKLFFELCEAKLIGITGTKGKGTTSSLIAKILSAGGKKAWLGGNIGRDPFEFLEQVNEKDFVVLELSSFQLQDLEKSPHITVVLSITPDHLNHHKGIDEYIESKSSILKFQTPDDFAVLHPNLPDWFKNLGAGKKIFFIPDEASGYKTQLLGKHNWENIAAAVEVAKVLRVDDQTIRKTVEMFQPLPHRLNFLKEIDGVKFIDDTYSTNIEPTLAAIDAIDSNIILIVGGSEKKSNFAPLCEKIKSTPKVKGLIVIGQVTDKIVKNITGFTGKILTGAKNTEQIISLARSLAQTGDTILFSPATASLDMFKNETDRGEQFVNEVLKLM